MTDKPAEHLEWENTGSEPSDGLKTNGYAFGSVLASAQLNYYLRLFDQWNKWSEEQIEYLLDYGSGGGGGGDSGWLSGAGAPAGALGADGDFYLNLTNGDVYLKDAGSWAIVGNIVGDSENTPNAIVKRDGTGKFKANDIVIFEGTDRELMLGEALFDLASTGAKTFLGFTITGGNTTFTVGSGTGQIFDHVTQEHFEIVWPDFPGQVPAVPTGITYVYINRSEAVVITSVAPTGNTRRDMIFLGKIGALSGIITGYTVNLITSTAVNADLFDLGEGIAAFKVDDGLVVTPNGVNLNINRSTGGIFQLGINFLIDPNNPNIKTFVQATAPTMIRATRNLVTGTSALIDPGNYDVAGTVTPVPGANSRATIQRLYQFTGSGNNIAVQYGQAWYASLSDAVQAITSELFEVNPNIVGNAILIGVLCVVKNASDLSDIAQARFFKSSRFGEAGVGASGSSVSTFQNVWQNSSSPEITTDSTRGGFTVRRGSAADTDNIYEGENGAGSTTFSVSGDGTISGVDLNISDDAVIGDDLTVNGDTILQGNLTVNGTTTSLNTSDLQVEDKLVQINYGGTNATAEGAGFEVVGTANAAQARILYDSTMASKFKAGTAGSEKELLNIDAIQTVQNKTLDNTNTAHLKDNLLIIEDPSDATKKLRLDAGLVTPGQTRVLQAPNADAELLGKDTQQVVTNKDIDGGTASNLFRFTVPKNTLANLLALTRKEATLVYATDMSAYYQDNGSTLVAIPTGTLLSNPMDSAGDMIVGGASGAVTKLDHGTLGYFLMAKGAAPPEWTDTPSIGLKYPAFSATKNASQSINNGGADQKIAFQTEAFDTTAAYDNATNYRFTPQVAGIYAVSVTLVMDNLADQKNAQAYIWKNGASVASQAVYTSIGGGSVYVTCYAMISMNGSTDYLEAYGNHNDTSARNVLSGAALSRFSAHFVSKP